MFGPIEIVGRKKSGDHFCMKMLGQMCGRKRTKKKMMSDWRPRKRDAQKLERLTRQAKPKEPFRPVYRQQENQRHWRQIEALAKKKPKTISIVVVAWELVQREQRRSSVEDEGRKDDDCTEIVGDDCIHGSKSWLGIKKRANLVCLGSTRSCWKRRQQEQPKRTT